MLGWAFDLSRTRKARKAVGARIAPLVERSRSRLGGLPDAVWSDPYIVGFMVMLITIVAKAVIGKIGERALCQIQTKAWADITMQPHAIGEEVILLSASRNPDFESGCRNATAFASIFVSNLILNRDFGSDWRNLQFDLHGASSTPLDWDGLSEMWEAFFDRHMSAYLHYNREVDRVF